MNGLIVHAAEVCSNGTCGQAEIDEGAIVGMIAAFGVFFFVIIILAMLSLAFWIWMFVDSVKRTEKSYQSIGSGEKNLWIVLMVVSLLFSFYFVVALVYYFVIYKKDKKLIEKK